MSINDPYWQQDAYLLSGIFRYYHQEPRQVRTFIHLKPEHYELRCSSAEVIPLQHSAGERTYLHFQPYVFERQMRITVGLYPQTHPHEVIGEVISAGLDPQQPIRRHKVGTAQGWYYPAEGTLVIWECFFERWLRDTSLVEDSNMRSLWLAVEQWATRQFPHTRRIVTPFRDPEFDDKQYQTFLHQLGYTPIAQAAWGKEPS